MWKKFYVVLALLFLASLPLYSESNETLEIPNLELEATYEIQGKDLMTLYTTIKELNGTKTEYQNLTNEIMKTLEDVMTSLNECAEENEKLILENNFLIGTTVCSIGICVAGVITWACTTGFN